jgi:Uma2 family endonuclease
MSSALAPLPHVESVDLRRKHWTVSEIYRALDAGLLAGQRFELIHGEILVRMSHNPIHSSTFDSIVEWLLTFLSNRQFRIQMPIRLVGEDREYSEPEPDIVVHSLDRETLKTRHPEPQEILLLIEIANSSSVLDAIVKRDLYARSGICEYWLFDVKQRTLTVHLEPRDGTYRRVSVSAIEGQVTAGFAPDQEVSVARLFDVSL